MNNAQPPKMTDGASTKHGGPQNVAESQHRDVKGVARDAEIASGGGISSWHDHHWLLLLLILYVILHGLIGIRIPVCTPAVHNDDWCYSYTVQRWCEGDGFRLHPLAGVWAIPQIVFGVLLCKIAGGFSHELLRAAMVVFGFISIQQLFRLLRQLQWPGPSACFGAAIFLFNPLVVSLTWSFHTDIVYVTFVIVAVRAMVAADQTGRSRFAMVSVAAIVMAGLTRQTAIFDAAALGMFCLFHRRWTWSSSFLITIPLLLLIERQLISQSELKYLPYIQGLMRQAALHPTLRQAIVFVNEGLHLALLMGLLLAPILLMNGWSVPKESRRRWVACSAAIVLAAVVLLDLRSGRSFLLGNYLCASDRIGIGPATLALEGQPTVMMRGTVKLSWWMWGLVVVCLAGGSLWIQSLWSSSRAAFVRDREQSRPSFGPALYVLVFHLLGLLLSAAWMGRGLFDRYAITLLPLTIALLAGTHWPMRRLVFAAIPWLTILAIADYGGVVDYWEWNAARWKGVRLLEEKGIDYRMIDGGYEYNAMQGTLASPIPLQLPRMLSPRADGSSKNPPQRDLFTVRFQIPNGLDEVVATIPFRRPFRSEDDFLYVTKRRLKKE